MYGFKKLYFSSYNNIARWLGVDLGRTANTLAKSDGPKVDARAFYRKFKSGSSETIHYVQRALYFKTASYQNTAGYTIFVAGALAGGLAGACAGAAQKLSLAASMPASPQYKLNMDNFSHGTQGALAT